ncbi:MAG: SDR family NAD(P)-dependent oxidoreductase [Flavobacteriaceae bacterium]|nr:SDR family NAD(P)-dependent oxidoreductase [Flavobacteriaceae bacterium]
MAKVIITGCSRGIGYQLAQLFSDAGHEVLALSRNDEPVRALKLKKLHCFPFDISKESSLTKVGEFIEDHWKKVDILIHNAGMLINNSFETTTTEQFEEVYKVNVFGVAALTRKVLPYLSKKGHVLTISSMGGVQGSAKFPGLAAYSSSKGAVITLTELLAEEYKETGPSFNVLALGAVQTEMLEEAFPGYKAPVTAEQMASYIMDFALNGHSLYNGKLLQVSNSTP